jgi:hypothetical protein
LASSSSTFEQSQFVIEAEAEEEAEVEVEAGAEEAEAEIEIVAEAEHKFVGATFATTATPPNSSPRVRSYDMNNHWHTKTSADAASNVNAPSWPQTRMLLVWTEGSEFVLQQKNKENFIIAFLFGSTSRLKS